MELKNTLKVIGISLLGVLGVGMSCYSHSVGMTLLAPSYEKVGAYSVNENQESVTFTKEELNNCTYSYLYDFDMNSQYTGTHIQYGNDTYNYIGYNLTTVSQDYPNAYWYQTSSNQDLEYIIFNSDGKFYLWVFDEFLDTEWLHNLTIYSDYFAENMQKSITLSASQLNEKVYNYFSEYVSVDSTASSSLEYSYIIYNNNVYLYDTNSDTYGPDIYYINDNNTIYLQGNQWLFNDSIFTNSITIYSTYIADNLYAPYQPSTLLEIIVGLLTGGITGIASGVGSGVSTLTTQIFISNNALSVFGGMIVVFASVSLAIGLCRWIMQFLTSLGAKK